MEYETNSRGGLGITLTGVGGATWHARDKFSDWTGEKKDRRSFGAEVWDRLRIHYLRGWSGAFPTTLLLQAQGLDLEPNVISRVG